MAEESIFGTAGDPANREDPAWLDNPWEGAPTTAPPTVDETEGSPAEAAPEVTPAPAPDGTQEASTPEGPPQPAAEATPEELAQLQAAQAAAAAGAQEAPPEGETPAEEAQRLYANKYSTPEALEQGYRERSDMWRRAMEQAQAQEARAAQADAQRAQYEQALRAAIPTIEQAARERAAFRAWAQQYKNENGELPTGLPADFLSAPAPAGPPEGMVDRRQVEQMLEQRLAEQRQADAEAYERQQEFAALQRTVTEFYTDHPEVEQRGALDNEITDAMAELAYSPAWAGYVNEDGSSGVVVDPTDRNSVEVVYEAVRRPALLEILKLRPDYFTSGAGLAIARRDAAVLEGAPVTTDPQTATVPASRAGTRAGQRVPFVESAAGSVPKADQPNPNDPWAQVKAVDEESRGGRSKPIFLE